MRASTLCVLLAATSLLLPGAEPPATYSTTLANGMKLIVQEDHDIPNVAMYLFFKVGSRNERPGITGISHFFEHMMFNGAKKYGPKQFDIEMEKAGGRNNAYTSNDVTVYTDWFPRTALRLMFDMEADRMQNLAFDPKIVESERGVVYSERQTSVDNSNFGTLYEQLNAAAFTAHPYGWSVIGWPSDIQAWTMEDLKSHYRMGYAPNNCVAVIVGDVSTAEIVKLAKEFWEPIPRQEPPPPVRTVEPPQRGERRVVVQKAAQLPVQMIAYHSPAGRDPDFLPLRLLGGVLTEGRSSRMYRRLVDQGQLALSVSEFLERHLDPGLMVFVVSPRQGVDPAATEKALYEEIEAVRTAEVSAAELQKAKNLLLTRFFREMKTIGGRANMIGESEVFRGDYKLLQNVQEEIEAVTPADLLRVAKKYLNASNRTVATLIPEKAAEVKR